LPQKEKIKEEKTMTKKYPTDTPLALAGSSIAFGQIGGALGSTGLQAAGTATNKFIAPSTSIGMGGMMINQLRGFAGKKNGKTKVL